MASKEVVDRYLIELGNYFNLCIGRHIKSCGGKAAFINSFIVCPYQDYENEEVFRLDDVGYVEVAMEDFYQIVGKELNVQVSSIRVNDDFDVILGFYFHPLFAQADDDPLMISLNKTLEINAEDYECYFGNYQDEVISNEINNLVKKIWRFNFNSAE